MSALEQMLAKHGLKADRVLKIVLKIWGILVAVLATKCPPQKTCSSCVFWAVFLKSISE